MDKLQPTVEVCDTESMGLVTVAEPDMATHELLSCGCYRTMPCVESDSCEGE